MAKRRVYTPERDRGWSNGRYWKPKQNEDAAEDVYDAYCVTCKKIAPHQWEECIMCAVNTEAKEKRDANNPDLDSFGKDIAEP